MPDDLTISRSLGGPTCATCPEPAVVQWQRRDAKDAAATRAVYSCGVHAISLDAGARVHQPTCTAPDPKMVPACDCAPEPLPAPDSLPGSKATETLPTGWTVPTTA